MKPEKLIISAFGPYSAKTEIDFKGLESGLYLITGNTGAGKTTIFDAICFALYGEPSGTARKTSMLRSKYAGDSTPTYVELYFSYGGHHYRIHRNPEYSRPKLRGQGFIKEAPGAELFFDNDTQPVSGAAAVTRKITEITGLDRQQFSQIAMIAQGDFQKLLLAETKERMEIFRRIFHTDRFLKLQESVLQDVHALQDDYRRNKDLLEKEIRTHLEVTTEDDREAAAGYIAGPGENEKICGIIDRMMENDKCAEQSACDQIAETESRIEKENAALLTLQQNEEARKRIEETRRRYLQEKEVLRIAAEELKAVEQWKIKEQALRESIAVAEGKRADYERLSDLNNKMEENAELLDQYRKAALLTEDACTRNAGEIQRTEAGILPAEELVKEQALKEAERNGLTEKAENLAHLSERCEAWHRDHKTQEQIQNRFREEDFEYREAAEAYEKNYRLFLGSQAGILARDLKEGVPCPVCGSLSHPDLAVIPENVPDEAAVRKLKKDQEKKEKQLRKTAEEASAAASAVRTRKEQLFSDLKKLNPGLEENAALSGEDPSAIRNWILKKLQNTEEQKKAASEILEQTEKKIVRNDALKSRLDKLRESAENLRSEKEELLRRIQTEEQTAARLLDEKNSLQKRLRYGSLEEAEKAVAAMKNEAETIRGTVEKAEKKKEKAEQELKGTQGALRALLEAILPEQEIKKGEEEELSGSLSGKSREAEILEKERSIRDLKNARSLMEKMRQEYRVRYENNRKVRQVFEKSLLLLSGLEEKLKWMNALGSTVAGKLEGKEKISLETYVQMHYFDRILSRANIRFMMMSQNQYEMRRSAEASNKMSKSGLEIDVIDHYNGTVRSVRTLSGGESFMASLSLAMGLSDEIQSESGGIRLDSMFIDEGFGSLDPETLSLAMQALTKIGESSRMVGIISHVGELRERIDRQIIVTKDKSGGSTALVRTEG